jgi:hypothetical protein
MMKNGWLFLFVVVGFAMYPQAYNIKTFNWKDAGYNGAKPVYTQTVNILNFGGNNLNQGSNHLALQSAIVALNNQPGVVFFPKGVYSFTASINVNRDSILFLGAGSDSSELRFNLSGVANNCFNIWGSTMVPDSSSFVSAGRRDSSSAEVMNAAIFQPGHWVYLQTSDNAYMFSSWALSSLGQIMQIKSINGNKITFESPFRFYYTLNLKPKITKIVPKQAIGFECIKLKRMDPTVQQTSLLSFDKAVQCWMHGIEGDSTNFAHVELSRCSNIEITNSYFHEAFGYGGGGQGYGISFQFSSNECKAENNVFRKLRHSILFQAGANGNVCGYNYSFEPFWNEGIFPTNSAGDIVFHGNFPFANLCEGNINQNTVIDNSHAKNGPYNTLFRNRSELWGLVMGNSPATDTVQFLGLEITNTSPFGQYIINGNGHLQHGNKVQGVLTPTNVTPLSENSLYLQGTNRPYCFAPDQYNWPAIGIPNTYNTGSNPAKDRVAQNKWTACQCTSLSTSIYENLNWSSASNIFPNPVKDRIQLNRLGKILELRIYTLNGELVLLQKETDQEAIDISQMQQGIYILVVNNGTLLKHHKIIKE